MNIKELLLVVGLALVTTWTIDYFMNRGKKDQPGTEQEVKAGQSFVAPKNPQSLRPLNIEVAFSEQKRPAPATLTEVKNRGALCVFSTDGAALERFEHRMGGHPGSDLTTIFPPAQGDREARCFLVALEKDTPYYYTLVDHTYDDIKTTMLTYKAENETAIITKIFTFFSSTNCISLRLTIEPKKGPVQARILYPAPLLPALGADDTKSGIYNDESGSIVTTPRSKINPDIYWHAPTFFGLDDRYFVHALVKDENHFVDRAYYKLSGAQDIYAFLESPSIATTTTWELKFYFGPKEACAMRAVDPRLEETLGYAGWFSPIAYWLLRLLIFLYRFLGNYGLAIIALTILTKIVLLPFSISGARSMKKHAEMQRKLKYLQQKYKDDPETLMRERTELMRKEGLSGLSGCLPILLQLPIFFALSKVLSTSIELYQAPFFGWITDLSARDPYYVLPLLVAVSMLLQATTVDASQRVQLIVMALVFGAITANLSAGLCLYIFMSTLLGVLQTMVQQRFKVA